MPHLTSAYQLAVGFLAQNGLGSIARSVQEGQPCILTFHGLRADHDGGLLDPDLHTPVSKFRDICHLLATRYRVMHLSQIVSAMRQRLPLPDGTVAITFDDGYASNHRLAWPVLREFSLPATIFLTTGFIDRTETLWFHRLEYALAWTEKRAITISIGPQPVMFSLVTTDEKARAYSVIAATIKSLPQERVPHQIDLIERALGVSLTGASDHDTPDILRPLSWANIREMRDSSLVEFGAHTHSHLILGRCSTDTARKEIVLSQRRIEDELGIAPRLFAYPNGQTGDFTSATEELLHQAGFDAGLTMLPGFVRPACNRFQLPRYGAPTSTHETEATVSGAFETLKQWRVAARRVIASIA